MKKLYILSTMFVLFGCGKIEYEEEIEIDTKLEQNEALEEQVIEEYEVFEEAFVVFEDDFKKNPIEKEETDIVESLETEIEPIIESVTISINCATVLNSDISEKLLSILPNDGIILSDITVDIADGQSVFDVLKMVCLDKNIQLEYVNTPIIGGAYIEGIANLYEFDAGGLSGWTYRVNGLFPNVSVSNYILRNGDKIELLYTCNLGEDVKNA